MPQPIKQKANTTPAKYIFLDVVGFTVARTVDAQTDIIEVLNSSVLTTLEEYKIAKKNCLLLPTGDGICIALLNVEAPYDIHLRIARKILTIVRFSFADPEPGADLDQIKLNEMRRFKVRIGLEECTDTLITDINGNKNIAGIGINMAQRVMGLADGNQILVSASVYKALQQHDEYFYKFRELPSARVKHGIELEVYQYTDEEGVGLDTSLPSYFAHADTAKQPKKLDRVAAFYVAYALKHKPSQIDRTQCYRHIIWYWALAGKATTFEKRAGESSDLKKLLAPVYEDEDGDWFTACESVPDALAIGFGSFIGQKLLAEHVDLFEHGGSDPFGFLFVDEKGSRQLQEEWPDIWKQFEFGKAAQLPDGVS